MSRGTISQNIALGDFIAKVDDRTLIQASPFVQSHIFLEWVNVVANFDTKRIDVGDFSSSSSMNHHAGVFCDRFFHSCTNDRRLCDQKRNRLSLHVRSHQSTVRIIVLKERNQARGNTHHLRWSDVDVLNVLWIGQFKVTTATCDHVAGQSFFASDRTVFYLGVCRTN